MTPRITKTARRRLPDDPSLKKSVVGRTLTVSGGGRAEREAAGLTVADLSKETSIPIHYLEALEQAQYENLPGELYIRGWIKKYAARFSLNEAELLSEYARERSVRSVVSTLDKREQERSSRIAFWKRFTLRRLGIAAVILAVAGYLAFVLYQSVKPPVVTFDPPLEDLRTQDTSIILKGTTEAGTTLTINKQAVTLAEDGTFSEIIPLNEGLQTFVIEAVQPRSFPFRKEVRVIRTLPPDLQLTTPTTTEEELITNEEL